jgi:hypothetical protein
MYGHDRLGAGHPRERRANGSGDALIEFVGHDPANVVCLEDLPVVGH